ncbi:hypothetical protein [Methylocystis sp. ATCC 49242]|uniref:hypothetical protein n=1 Tax=Methylocystis sp. ATCC 49242 TaxID=622637 RepID=UPI0001F86D45|nr:hypothetical protein [Methylocystis sp. ATCC 49242]
MPPHVKSPKGREPFRFSSELIDDAATFLDDLGIPKDPYAVRPQDVSRLTESALTVAKASREQHYRAFAYAYALWIHICCHPNTRELVFELASKCRLKLTEKTHPLRLCMQTLMHYGEDHRKAEKLYSRDVQAAEYLKSEKIRPSEVVQKALEKGQGLDAWARKKHRPGCDEIGEGHEANPHEEARATDDIIIEFKGDGFSERVTLPKNKDNEAFVRDILLKLARLKGNPVKPRKISAKAHRRNRPTPSRIRPTPPPAKSRVS